MVDPVKGPGPHVQHGHRPYDGHGHPGPGDGHQVSGSVMVMFSFVSPRHEYEAPGGLADVDVPLHSQHQGKVDAGVVEHLGYRLREHLKEEAGGTAPVHVLVTGEKEMLIMFRPQRSYVTHLLNV